MASTYVNDLRLNEMATGDASGSWGTVTNTNLELIGEAFSYGTETIGDADSTLTIADGAADAARSFYLKITSSVDLTTTRIVTLAPNTVSKVWMIENATTGSQVITIKQGSGATINVPNGQVKMISTDGAGSGGAVLDLLVDVDLTGTTTLVNLDVSGTLGVTGVLTATSLDISGDIDVDGTTNLDVVDIDGATQIDATVTVGVNDTGYDVKFFGATTPFYINSAGFVFNEDSKDMDFRVESDTNAHMLFVDAGLERVNIGYVTTNSGVVSLSVTGVTPVSGTNTYYAQRISSEGFADSGAYTALIGLSVEPDAGWSKGAIGWTRTGGYDIGNIVFLNRSAFDASTAALSDERMRITSTGVVVTGSLSKSSGSFRIPHPIKSETHDLVHSFVEAPQADNIYRGKVTMIAGQASVNIDTIAGMTDGTFAVLNREVQCFTSNETGWTAVRGSVSGNILTIEAQDASCTDTISWMVIGERQDQHMYDTEWTDENGKVIVEPLKPVEE
jgi:hypothetical protein